MLVLPLLLACAKTTPAPAAAAPTDDAPAVGPQPGDVSFRFAPEPGDYGMRAPVRIVQQGPDGPVTTFVDAGGACTVTVDDVVRHRCGEGDDVMVVAGTLDGTRVWPEAVDGVEPVLSEAQAMQDWADGAGFFLGADVPPNQWFEADIGSPMHGASTRLFGVVPEYPCHYDDLEARCVRGVLIDQVDATHAWRRWIDLDPSTLTVWRQVDHDTSQRAASGAWMLGGYARIEGGHDGVRAPEGLTLPEARAAHTTQLVAELADTEAPGVPPADGPLERIDVPSGDLMLPAWLARAEGEREAPGPALVWLEGGLTQVLFDPEGGLPPGAAEAHAAGMTVLFPSQRGGHPGTGAAEGFLGEVDDVLAAAEHLASLPGVDPERIYLGGHSTGGTLALLTAASSDRWAGVVALGPVARIEGYGEDMSFVDLNDMAELRVRSPEHWMHTIASPTWVAEGVHDGNADDVLRMWADDTNEKVHFALAASHDHFTVVAPTLDLLARAWVAGEAPDEAALDAGLNGPSASR